MRFSDRPFHTPFAPALAGSAGVSGSSSSNPIRPAKDSDTPRMSAGCADPKMQKWQRRSLRRSSMAPRSARNTSGTVWASSRMVKSPSWFNSWVGPPQIAGEAVGPQDPCRRQTGMLHAPKSFSLPASRRPRRPLETVRTVPAIVVPPTVSSSRMRISSLSSDLQVF